MRFGLQDWDDEQLDVDCAAVILADDTVSLLTERGEQVLVARHAHSLFRLSDEFSQGYGGLDLHNDFAILGVADEQLELHGTAGLIERSKQVAIVANARGIDLCDGPRLFCRYEPGQGYRRVQGGAQLGTVTVAPASFFATPATSPLGPRQRLSPLGA